MLAAAHSPSWLGPDKRPCTVVAAIMDWPVKTLAVVTLYAWFLVIAQIADAHNVVPITASWTTVTTNENGEPIDPDDLIYAIMDRDVMQEMCATTSTECTFYVGQGECGSLYAVAYQISTGLESAPSNVIDVCADSRLNSPILEYIIGSR